MSDDATIYRQHDKAFQNVSAYAVLRGGEVVAKVAFKFPHDGAGRLYAYVHWIGSPMLRGHASGYGYDKRSAAVAGAISKVRCEALTTGLDGDRRMPRAFVDALATDGGSYWNTRLENAGFIVVQVV